MCGIRQTEAHLKQRKKWSSDQVLITSKHAQTVWSHAQLASRNVFNCMHDCNFHLISLCICNSLMHMCVFVCLGDSAMYCLLLYAVLSGSAVGSSALHTVSGGRADSLSGCSVGEQGNGFGQPQAKGGITHKHCHWAAAVPSMEGAMGAKPGPKISLLYHKTPRPAAAPQTNHTLKTGRWAEVEGAVCVSVRVWDR